MKNIRSAISKKGKVLVVDMVIPEGNEPSPAKLVDVQMLITTGGKERTQAEFRELLTASGFRLTRIVPTRSPMSIIEGVAK